MTKRIISLILVAVMAILALAGCAYSYADDDMTKYATFDKAAFAAAIAEIDIIDGDFTEDEETRALKVLDKINSTLASKADTTVHKSEGKPAAIDTIYYCYYVTAVIDEVEYVFLTENMKVEEASKMDKFQLGLNFPADDLTEKLVAEFSDFEFVSDSVYEQVSSGKVEDGMTVYISYERKYSTEKDGQTVEVVETAATHRVALDAASNKFHAGLIDKSIGATLSDSIEVSVEDDAKNYGTYSKIKVEWAEKGSESAVIVDVTYDVATNKATTLYTGTSKNKDLKDVELSYHIYPVYFVETPEFTATNVINDVYGESVTASAIATILFGKDYTEEEDADKVEALLATYKFTADGEEVELEDFVTALDNAQTALGDAEEALEKALDEYEDAKSEYEAAVKALEAAKTEKTTAENAYEANKTDENKTALDKATEAVTTAEGKVTKAKTDLEVAKEIYDGEKDLEKEGTAGEKGDLKTATEKRDTLVTELFTVVGAAAEGEGEAVAKGEAKIIEGYKTNVTYANLEDTYNTDIKNKLATVVYEKMVESVKVNSYPEKAVDDAYDYLIENYEYMFYENKTVTGGSVASTSDSNYKKYGGSFKTFLVEYAVPEDLEVKVSSYDEACAAIRKEAERHVGEMITVYIVSQAYGIMLSEDEFDAFKEEDSNYLYYGESYGEDTFRFALQFDKIMDAFLESEEVDGKTVYSNDYVKTVNRLTEEAYEEKYPTTDDTETE